MIDTGPLVALLDRRDHQHAWVKQQLAKIPAPLHTCEAVLTEACFLSRNLAGGQQAVMGLLQRGFLSLSFSLGEEASAIQSLLLRYADVPMSLADACLVRMMELESGILLTLDSDFQIYRMKGRAVIPVLIPENG